MDIAAQARTAGRRERAFTLLEMLAVLAIVALVAGVFSISIAGRLDKMKVSGAAKDVMSALRYTRSQAIVSRSEQVLEVDVEARTIQAPGRPPVQLPEAIEMRLLTAQQEVSDGSKGKIRFFSDGGSTGGKVTLLTDARTWEVKVSWLTGEIELDDGRDER
jgi:general secretion pathway protein H